MGGNTIDSYQMNQSHESQNTSLLISTCFVSFTAIFYGLFYLKQKVEKLLLEKEEEKNTDADIDFDVYQGWNGTYADGDNSLLIQIVRMKESSKRKNANWIDWDGEDDSSTVSRNFYLGNADPSFSWLRKVREDDVQGLVQETMTDGWSSLIRMKIECFVEQSEDMDMNLFLKNLIAQNKIEWTKILFTKEECRTIFG